jgi:hypothetical protein
LDDFIFLRGKQLSTKGARNMPCIHLKSGTKLNIDPESLKDKSFREFLKGLDLTEETIAVYFPELLSKKKPPE